MARKFKTYTTSIGFYDLAIAAPSMKAALEAWGARQNLFHQGSAEETDEATIVAATMEKPGVVLRRPVGSSDPFGEDTRLPTSLPKDLSRKTPEAKLKKPDRRKLRTTTPKDQRAAVIDFEHERVRRERERRQADLERTREQAARDREDERRLEAVAKAKAVRDRARKQHEKKLEQLQGHLEAVQSRLDAEEARWKEEERELDTHVQKASR